MEIVLASSFLIVLIILLIAIMLLAKSKDNTEEQLKNWLKENGEINKNE